MKSMEVHFGYGASGKCLAICGMLCETTYMRGVPAGPRVFCNFQQRKQATQNEPWWQSMALDGLQWPSFWSQTGTDRDMAALAMAPNHYSTVCAPCRPIPRSSNRFGPVARTADRGRQGRWQSVEPGALVRSTCRRDIDAMCVEMRVMLEYRWFVLICSEDFFLRRCYNHVNRMGTPRRTSPFDF